MFFDLHEQHSLQRPASRITWDKVKKSTELQRKHRLHPLRKLHAKSLPYLMKLEECGPRVGYAFKQPKRADRIYFKPRVEAKRLLNSKTLERRTFWGFNVIMFFQSSKIYQLLMMNNLNVRYRTFCTHCMCCSTRGFGKAIIVHLYSTFWKVSGI